MKRIIAFQNKFFAWEYDVLVLAIQAAILATIYSLAYVFYLPNDVSAIWAMIGVFVNALIQTVAINGSHRNRFYGGIIIAISAGITTFLGALCADSFTFTSIFLLLLVPLVGLSSSAAPLSAAIVLFTVDLFIVGSSVPAHFITALSYGVAFTFGGLSLCIVAWVSARVLGQQEIIQKKYKFIWQVVLAKYKLNISFSILLTFVVFMANVISYKLKMPQGFWIPMTALLILKSDYDFTRSRMSHRLFGTMLGSAIAIIVAIVFLSKLALALLMFPLLFFIVVSMAKHYGAYTLVLTIMVTVMVNLIVAQGYLIAEHRLIDTLLGVVIVMVSLWLVQPLIAKLHKN